MPISLKLSSHGCEGEGEVWGDGKREKEKSKKKKNKRKKRQKEKWAAVRGERGEREESEIENKTAVEGNVTLYVKAEG